MDVAASEKYSDTSEDSLNLAMMVDRCEGGVDPVWRCKGVGDEV